MSLSSGARLLARPVVLIALCTSLLPGAHVAFAQSPEPVETVDPALPRAEITLVDQPIWYEPGDKLDIEVEVTNTGSVPIEGFQIIVGVENKVTTRSALQQGFEAAPGLVPSSLPFSFEEDIAPLGSSTIVIDGPVDSFPTLSTAISGGVFPATVAARTADGATTLDSLGTPLIYYPEPPEKQLNLALMLPLNSGATRGPDGSFRANENGSSLVNALAPGGWLRGYLKALGQASTQPEPEAPERGDKKRKDREEPEPPIEPLHLSLGITPRLVEELAAMSDGFTIDERTFPADSEEAVAAADALARLRRLMALPSVQPVTIPYAFPDLPTLVEQLPLEHTLQQFSSGVNVINEILGVDLEGAWLFPPAGRLDAGSLQQLQVLYDEFFVSPKSVEPLPELTSGCPELSFSFTCVAEIQSTEGRSKALVADEGLTDRFADLQLRANDRLILQQFFAETSMIREEAPGLSDRVVQATVPSLWHPTPKLSRLLLQGLRRAPWLRPVTGEEAVEFGQVADRRIVTDAPDIKSQPDSSFFFEVATANRLVDSYSSMVPPTVQRTVRMKRNILTAVGRSLWRRPDEAIEYLTRTSAEIDDEFSKIMLSGPQAFTFTARQGDLQFVVVNNADYPVKLALTLTSRELELDNTRVVETFPPGNSTFTVQAEARSSGEFPIEVRLQTTDVAGLTVEETLIAIRSTSLNRIALLITLGALGFLILFYVLRAVRRRGQPQEATG